MEGNINLTFEEFMEFIKLQTRVEVLKDMIADKEYVPVSLIHTIFEVEDDGKL